MDKKLNLSEYYLTPGFAYGGSCLPKDLKGLNAIAHDNYLNTPVLSSIEISNNYQKSVAIEQIESYKKKKLGILGLSFKPGTDDLRYSPTVDIAEHFLGKGYSLRIYDENVNLSIITGTNKDYIDAHIPHLSELIYDHLKSVIENSEIIVITQKFENLEHYIVDYPEKTFVDFARITDKIFDNYEGIAW